MGRDLLLPGLVWICDPQGVPRGAGVLVGPTLILTCAHVVTAALRIPASDSAPTDPVQVVFTHVEDSLPRRAAVRPGRWFPPIGGGIDGASDIALLDLLDAPPVRANPVPPLVVATTTGNEVHAYGLPRGHRKEGGGFASGSLAGLQGSGLVQIDGPAEGYRIQPGFSGAAAWSDEDDAVLGIIVAAEEMPDLRIAWMIPTALINRRCPEVPIALTSPTPTARSETAVSASDTLVEKTTWDWSINEQGDWIARVGRDICNVFPTPIRDLPQEREGLRKGRVFDRDDFIVSDKNYEIEFMRNELRPNNALPVPLRRGSWDQYLWLPQVEPALAPGQKLSYEHVMRVPGSEKEAFRRTGTHAGVLITAPTAEGEIVLRAPAGYSVTLTDTIVRFEDDGADGQRESRELDRVGRPAIEDGGAILRWKLTQPAQHLRYQFGYRLSRR